MRLTASDRAADSALALYWSAPVPVARAIAAKLGPAEIAVKVYANHGRWVVECPDCKGAQIASATDRRFMCHCCGNALVEGLWRAVVWPEEYAEIDEALAWRPVVNQNWLPGETLDDLEAEAQAAEARGGVGRPAVRKARA